MSNGISAPEQGTHVPSHPIVFFFLILPFGVIAGLLGTTFEFMYSKAGISVGVFSAVVAASLLPHTFKFLWAPLVDTTFTLKKWYLVSSVITSASILATGMLPLKESSLPLLTVIGVIGNIAVSFLGIATNGLAAHDTPHEMKGRVSGYFNAGNLGGAGIGGGAGIWLAQKITNLWAMPAIIAVACLLCSLALFFVKEPVIGIKAEKAIETVNNLVKDIWDTVKARLGFLALFLCFLPLGTGAAANLWAGVAGDWHASANTVALVTGIISGIITAGGSLIGGWLCDRMSRQMAYVLFGLLSAITAVGMAYTPHIELMYIIWTSLYAFFLGFCYAAFSAFVFEAIGKGAAGTKYTVYSSLSNIPIWYMTIVDGWAYTKYSPNGMLDIEAVLGVVGIVLFLVIFKIVDSRKTIAEAATVSEI